MKKGRLVETCGRLGINAWKNMEGDAKASLSLHVNFIQLHGGKKTGDITSASSEGAPDATDDLPF